MNISDEAFRAAEAIYMKKIVELRLAEGGGFKVPSQQKRAMRAALEAAAPYMLAGAFEAAADELDGKRLLTKPFHEYYPEWLRTRANELKTTNPYRSQSHDQ